MTQQEYIDKISCKFEDYYEEQRYIDNQIERYERMYARTFGLSASEITDMPHAPSPAMDKFTDKIQVLEEMEKSVKDIITLHTEMQHEIEDVITLLRKADEKTVIQLRYLDCMTWKEITECLYGGEKDYDLKYDTFLRRAFQQRTNAIQALSLIVLEGKRPVPKFLQHL